MIGSFALDGKTINIETDYNHIDGIVYRFVRADTGKEVAATSYRGMDLAAGVQYSKVELQRGLETVRRKARR
jgi:hypothetical protein